MQLKFGHSRHTCITQRYKSGLHSKKWGYKADAVYALYNLAFNLWEILKDHGDILRSSRTPAEITLLWNWCHSSATYPTTNLHHSDTLTKYHDSWVIFVEVCNAQDRKYIWHVRAAQSRLHTHVVRWVSLPEYRTNENDFISFGIYRKSSEKPVRKRGSSYDILDSFDIEEPDLKLISGHFDAAWSQMPQMPVIMFPEKPLVHKRFEPLGSSGL